MTAELIHSEDFPIVFIEGDVPMKPLKDLRKKVSYVTTNSDNSKKEESLLKKTPNGTRYVPIGLISFVKDTLSDHGIDFIENTNNVPTKPVLNLGWSKYVLRPYQKEALNAFLNNRCGTISLPTGTGKTLIGVKAIHSLKLPTLITVHRRQVADQWVEKIQEIMGITPARYYKGHKENGPIQVALYQSIHQEGGINKDISLNHDFYLADEVHSVGSETHHRVAMAVNAKWRLGLSATPKRQDGADLRMWASTGPIICEYSPEWMVNKGYLANPVFNIYKSPKAGEGYDSWPEEYSSEIVNNTERNKLIAREAKSLVKKGMSVCIPVQRIKHGELLEDLIPSSRFIQGSTSNRDELIRKFKNKQIPVVVTTLLSEGFDFPELNCVIQAGGMKSEIMSIQRIGRAIRPSGGDNAIIIDFIDNGNWVSKHSHQRIQTYKKYYGRYFRPSMIGRLNSGRG